MATIKDVAKAAGVSVATVSRVVNHSPQVSQSALDAVTAAMKKLNYRPNAAARALVNQTTNYVGIVVNDASDPFFGMLITAVDKVIRQFDKQLLIGCGYHNANDERRALEFLINSGCESIILHAKGLSDQEIRDYCQRVRGLVIINRSVDGIEERCVSLDNYHGAFIATTHLIKQGHRQIACVASDQDIEDTHERIRGYSDALTQHGIALTQNYIESGTPTAEGGSTAMMNLLSKSLEITAVVAYNDYMAAGVFETLEENGLNVPENISVVGFDDALIAQFVRPRLTTVRYPIAIMAQHAAQLALALPSQNSTEITTSFTPTLVLRNSTATL
ncbi:substrate-binding domain-containing protein [Vibrio sp. SM6]|uniref:Substrate-binding domain-containing protein n=1 Tax=Vibrio agarilyticus TaxID=2726741 RepID=A0A7X8YGG5_9VIBR|nr:substrate-binding domain-containing protein [Vibrio agarilyticus]NLS12669.1 substrate-binding domain-containing protein [Vibrio agarilyticus]